MQEVVSFGMWGSTGLSNAVYISLFAPALILIDSLMLNATFNRNEFMERNSHLTPLLYATFMSYFHSFYFIDGLSLAQTFLVLGVYQLFKLSQNEDGRRIVFNASFFFGIACTFYPPLVVSLPFLFLMIWLLRPFILRESVLIITGFVIALIYSGSYSYVFHTQMEKSEFSSSAHAFYVLDVLVVVGIAVLLVLFSLKGLFEKIGASSIRMKKLFRLLLLFLVMILIITLLDFFAFHKVDGISLFIIALVLIIPYAYGKKVQKTIPTVIFYVLFFYSVSKFFVPYEALAF